MADDLFSSSYKKHNQKVKKASNRSKKSGDEDYQASGTQRGNPQWAKGGGGRGRGRGGRPPSEFKRSGRKKKGAEEDSDYEGHPDDSESESEYDDFDYEDREDISHLFENNNNNNNQGGEDENDFLEDFEFGVDGHVDLSSLSKEDADRMGLKFISGPLGVVQRVKYKNGIKKAKKTPWQPLEDEALARGVQKHGEGKWTAILYDEVLKFVLYGHTTYDLRNRWKTIGAEYATKTFTEPLIVPPNFVSSYADAHTTKKPTIVQPKRYFPTLPVDYEARTAIKVEDSIIQSIEAGGSIPPLNPYAHEDDILITASSVGEALYDFYLHSKCYHVTLDDKGKYSIALSTIRNHLIRTLGFQHVEALELTHALHSEPNLRNRIKLLNLALAVHFGVDIDDHQSNLEKSESNRKDVENVVFTLINAMAPYGDFPAIRNRFENEEQRRILFESIHGSAADRAAKIQADEENFKKQLMIHQETMHQTSVYAQREATQANQANAQVAVANAQLAQAVQNEQSLLNLIHQTNNSLSVATAGSDDHKTLTSQHAALMSNLAHMKTTIQTLHNHLQQCLQIQQQANMSSQKSQELVMTQKTEFMRIKAHYQNELDQARLRHDMLLQQEKAQISPSVHQQILLMKQRHQQQEEQLLLFKIQNEQLQAKIQEDLKKTHEQNQQKALNAIQKALVSVEKARPPWSTPAGSVEPSSVVMASEVGEGAGTSVTAAGLAGASEGSSKHSSNHAHHKPKANHDHSKVNNQSQSNHHTGSSLPPSTGHTQSTQSHVSGSGSIPLPPAVNPLFKKSAVPYTFIKMSRIILKNLNPSSTNKNNKSNNNNKSSKKEKQHYKFIRLDKSPLTITYLKGEEAEAEADAGSETNTDNDEFMDNNNDPDERYTIRLKKLPEGGFSLVQES